MPPLPQELSERPGIVWLYQCSLAGLSPDNLKSMRIDQVEALIELHEFVDDAIAHRDEDKQAADTESSFWNL